jgi:predicted DNA-binding protein
MTKRKSAPARDDDAGTSMRLPRHTKAVLDALSALTGIPINRLVSLAVERYVKGLSNAEQRLVRQIRQRRRR